MKLLHRIVLLIVAGSSPATAIAQDSNGPQTRAQVLQRLVDLEGVGYRPSLASSRPFPYDIEAAEARLAAKKRKRQVPERLQPLPTAPDSSDQN